MRLEQLTPAQVDLLIEAECTAAEKAEVRAAVRQLRDSVFACLKQSADQGVAEGLLLAGDLQKVRAGFSRKVNRIAESARRRYLDRTLHGREVGDSLGS
ncbi:hypothetical protein [Streptomyces silvisoli]|uniref:Uncharacterized protein n=1 Tax=Streptomyces silvisoli TaxID=3034235 RepID=A0ABT5ZFX1_9ACTN|nr:hypothetical protein [Streptomyces silvisoli]MDF3288720.1 hypothetical protein [Streptomyces silvisoli]